MGQGHSKQWRGLKAVQLQKNTCHKRCSQAKRNNSVCFQLSESTKLPCPKALQHYLAYMPLSVFAQLKPHQVPELTLRADVKESACPHVLSRYQSAIHDSLRVESESDSRQAWTGFLLYDLCCWSATWEASSNGHSEQAYSPWCVWIFLSAERWPCTGCAISTFPSVGLTWLLSGSNRLCSL